MNRVTEEEIKCILKQTEEFLTDVPLEQRDTYTSFIKAAYLHYKESQLNCEFLKQIIPMLTPPDKEPSEIYTWDLMKGK